VPLSVELNDLMHVRLKDFIICFIFIIFIPLSYADGTNLQKVRMKQSIDDQPKGLTACKTDSDCVLVAGYCGSPVSITKKYADKFKKEEEEKKQDNKDEKSDRPTVDVQPMCNSNFIPGEWPIGAKARCVNGQCDVGF